jgi:type IV secretory pathway VirB9-like protein
VAGDSFAKISKATGIAVGDLEKWNPVLAERGLWTGDKVRLSAPDAAEAEAMARQAKKIAHAGKVPHEGPVKAGDGASTADGAGAAKAEAPSVTVQKPATKPPVQQVPKQVVEVREVKPDPVRVLRDTGATRDVLYSPDAIPTVNCEQKIAVTIYLPDKEKIVETVAGDVDEWWITPAVGKNVILVKAALPDKKTNLVVFTRSGNTYHITLTSDSTKPYLQILRIHPPLSDEDDSGVITPGGNLDLGGGAGRAEGVEGVGSSLGIPTDRSGRMDPAQVQAAIARVREEDAQLARQRERDFMQAMLAGRNDQFKISYDWSTPFRVTNVFSASGVTYLRVEVPNGLQPLLYVIEDGKESVVPWTVSRVDPNVIMVDRVFEKAVLVLGKKRARIVNVGLQRQMAKVKKEAYHG